jgi:hypothetical protein
VSWVSVAFLVLFWLNKNNKMTWMSATIAFKCQEIVTPAETRVNVKTALVYQTLCKTRYMIPLFGFNKIWSYPPSTNIQPQTWIRKREAFSRLMEVKIYNSRASKTGSKRKSTTLPENSPPQQQWHIED